MPKLDCGFVEFSPDELGLMREHGICIFCDFQKTCQIRREQLARLGKLRVREGMVEEMKANIFSVALYHRLRKKSMFASCLHHDIQAYKVMVRLMFAAKP